ncbi:MAG: hypothetical protein ACRDYA_08135 [Egibacteraceae bacterium]
MNGTWDRFAARPHQTMLGIAAAYAGLVAVIIGPAVSFSVTKVLGVAPDVVRAWGVTLGLGGALMSVGILAKRSQIEQIGLGLLGPALLLYGLTVLVALGRGGQVTGPLCVGLGIGSMVKSAVLARRARVLAKVSRQLNRGLDGE